MAIDFSLSAQQRELQRVAREFALEVLKPLIVAADAEPDPQKGFAMVRPAYEKAYELGFATGFLPERYGGGGLSNMDVQVAAEEIAAVDPGFACILLVNGLALMPLVWLGRRSRRRGG
ncbi:MAG: acyl-CoA dehydrogenase family protein [Solirubrobacteraceae bacterium]